VIQKLLLLEEAGSDPIKVFIDSPGGDADAGFAIFDMMRFITPKVYTIGMGLVASAAAIILLASPKECRLGLPNSHYLIHQPLSGIRGVATEIEIHAKELEKLRVKINELIAKETGMNIVQVEKDTDRDFWMNSDEAVKYGLISSIVARGGICRHDEGRLHLLHPDLSLPVSRHRISPVPKPSGAARSGIS
jgi:ATP-dependent Clp protease protease subunit